MVHHLAPDVIVAAIDRVARQAQVSQSVMPAKAQ
jgi:hypothetical protein